MARHRKPRDIEDLIRDRQEPQTVGKHRRPEDLPDGGTPDPRDVALIDGRTWKPQDPQA